MYYFYTIGCLQEVPKMKLLLMINSQCHRGFTRTLISAVNVQFSITVKSHFLLSVDGFRLYIFTAVCII